MTITKRNVTSRSLVSIVTVLVLTVIMLVPAVFYGELAVIRDSMPAGVYYPLWPAGFFVIDIGLLVFLFARLVVSPPRRLRVSNTLLGLFCAFIMCSALALQFRGGFFLEFYDGVAFILRFAIIFLMLKHLVQSDFLVAYKLIASIIFLLFVVSMTAFFIVGIEENTSGRLNLVGMGPNVSCDVLLMVYSVSLVLYRREYIGMSWLIAALMPLLLFIPFTGSRRAFVFGLALMFLTLSWRQRTIIGVCLLLLGYALADYLGLNLSEAVSEISTIVRVLESLEQLSTGSFQDGRSEMYRIATETVKANPFGIGLSDWAIQYEMGLHGVGSHTHNFFIQMYLKFGIFSIFIYGLFFRFIYFLVSHKYWFHLLFFGITLNTGYGFWNIKYGLTFAWVGLLLAEITNIEKLTSSGKDKYSAT